MSSFNKIEEDSYSANAVSLPDYNKLTADRFKTGTDRKEWLMKLYPKTTWDDILTLRRGDHDHDPIVNYLTKNIETLSRVGYKEVAEKHLKDYRQQMYPELFGPSRSL